MTNFLNKLKEFSNRGKVAFAICCFENAIKYYGLNKVNWLFVIQELWSFCNSSMAIWQEKFGELTPFVVNENVDFKIKDYHYLSKEQHDNLQSLYKDAPAVILVLLGLIYDIGITNVLVKVNSNSLKEAQLPFLNDIIKLMEENNIPLPEIELFEKFPITENEGWGREFTREDIFNEEV
jgi:hypothetical protein